MLESRELPERVRLPDGRTEPFAPERIARSLFEAAARVGVVDAFLARELTESSLHFLSQVADGREVTIDQIVEVVSKAVRELGQPAIAHEYENRPTRTELPRPSTITSPPELQAGVAPLEAVHFVARERLTRVSLERVYPSDLVSAHQEGLIRLTDLDHPFELDGLVQSSFGWSECRLARLLSARLIAIDGPEHDLDASTNVEQLARSWSEAAESFGVHALINLNSSAPARLLEATGPLFSNDSPSKPTSYHQALSLARAIDAPNLTVIWHLSEVDFVDSARQTDLATVVLCSPSIEFAFDRPRGSVVLGPGLDRNTPATLTTVGINLSQLLQQLGGPPVDPERFLSKVASLTRFAKTAGHVRQDFLRRHGRAPLQEAFLLDRARLVLVPMGLDLVASATDRPPQELARDILRTIRSAAETDRPRTMPVRVDSPAGNWGGIPLPAPSTGRNAIRAASSLHHAAGGGRLELQSVADPAEAIGLLKLALDGHISRLRFVR